MPRKKSTELAVVPLPVQPKREVMVSDDPIPTLDTARFEHMQRIANAMAVGLLIPDTIYKSSEGMFSKEMIAARCFQIVNQAVRWGLDPFAVAQCTSVIAGKLCYEGKLVQAVLESKLGIDFEMTYAGKDDSDAYGITVKGTFPDGKVREVKGSVADWQTGQKGPWSSKKNWRRMLHYRGVREWARFWAPALILGVYTDEEMEDLAEDARSRRATPVNSGLAGRLIGRGPGFSTADVSGEMGGKRDQPKDTDPEGERTAQPEGGEPSEVAGEGAAEDRKDAPATDASGFTEAERTLLADLAADWAECEDEAQSSIIWNKHWPAIEKSRAEVRVEAERRYAVKRDKMGRKVKRK